MVWLGETLQKVGSAGVKVVQSLTRNNKNTLFEVREDMGLEFWAEDGCEASSRVIRLCFHFVCQVSYLGLSLLGSWLILRWALKQMDPTKKNVETVCGIRLGTGVIIW